MADTGTDTLVARLVERVEALEAELRQVKSEARATAVDGPLSRRALLRLAGAGVVGAGAAVAGSTSSAGPAAATQGNMQFGTVNDAGTDKTELDSSGAPTTLYAKNTSSDNGLIAGGIALRGELTSASNRSPAVLGQTAGSGPAVKGVKTATASSAEGAVLGIAENGPGVAGVLHGNSAATTAMAHRAGLLGETDGTLAAGVTGLCNGGDNGSVGVFGVRGSQANLVTIPVAPNATSATVPSAVFGSTNAGPYAVVGVNSVGTGVYGCAFDSGDPSTPPVAAVAGDTNSAGVPAVFGRSSAGIGVRAHGGVAPLLLDPAATAGAPTGGAHSKGEVFVDVNGVFWLCTFAGSPGTWVRIITSGVNAAPATGPGLQVNEAGTTGGALVGNITNSASGQNAVYGVTNGAGRGLAGTNTGTGIGLSGQITNANNANPALYGLTNGKGPGVQANQTGTGYGVLGNITNTANSVAAVRAVTNGTGPALQAAGGRAQVNLVPASTAGPPTSGQTGDLFLDSGASLFLCTVGGSSATWKELQVA